MLMLLLYKPKPLLNYKTLIMKILYFFIIFCLCASRIYAYNISASILPLQSLVSMVTEGITPVNLILNPNILPHDLELTYKQQTAINKSDVLVIVSPKLETVIYNAATNKNNIISMVNAPKIKLSYYTNNFVLNSASSSTNKQIIDPHIWLDPNNAIVFLQYLAQELAKIDSKNAKQYYNNAAKYTKLLQSMNSKIQPNTEDLNNFLVYHNGYSYLINSFHLQKHYKGYIAKHSHESNAISIKSLLNLKTFISKNNVTCILTEKNIADPNIQKFIQDNHIKTKSLDAIGKEEPKIQKVYFSIISNNIAAINSCSHR